LVIFLLLELAPGDPMAQVPLTVPPEVKQKMREALGLGEPVPTSASGNGWCSSSGSNRWS
jgi:ABC-type dipeptide/oligopeptide/nickel transport system permease component